MGLLDDAIREHLDLKRARGADPAEIERLEREALGPVRRQPSAGSMHFDAPEEHGVRSFQSEYDDLHGSYDEPLTELEELQQHGYHDSTAPHPHAHYEHAHGDEMDDELTHHDRAAEHHGFEFGHPASEAVDEQALEQAPTESAAPKRRFLRRGRPDLPTGPAAPAPGSQDPSSSDREDDAAPGRYPSEDDPPPQLRLQQPPKRPRFTAEPTPLQPELEDEEDLQPVAPEDHDLHSQAEPRIDDREEFEATPIDDREGFEATPIDDREARPDDPETQETTEFDVEGHVAESRDAERLHDVDDDVLEETPEFLQDTPEHDRLWFEQRPPRDFDFDG